MTLPRKRCGTPSERLADAARQLAEAREMTLAEGERDVRQPPGARGTQGRR